MPTNNAVNNTNGSNELANAAQINSLISEALNRSNNPLDKNYASQNLQGWPAYNNALSESEYERLQQQLQNSEALSLDATNSQADILTKEFVHQPIAANTQLDEQAIVSRVKSVQDEILNDETNVFSDVTPTLVNALLHDVLVDETRQQFMQAFSKDDLTNVLFKSYAETTKASLNNVGREFFNKSELTNDYISPESAPFESINMRSFEKDVLRASIGKDADYLSLGEKQFIYSVLKDEISENPHYRAIDVLDTSDAIMQQYSEKLDALKLSTNASNKYSQFRNAVEGAIQEVHQQGGTVNFSEQFLKSPTVSLEDSSPDDGYAEMMYMGLDDDAIVQDDLELMMMGSQSKNTNTNFERTTLKKPIAAAVVAGAAISASNESNEGQVSEDLIDFKELEYVTKLIDNAKNSDSTDRPVNFLKNYDVDITPIKDTLKTANETMNSMGVPNDIRVAIIQNELSNCIYKEASKLKSEIERSVGNSKDKNEDINRLLSSSYTLQKQMTVEHFNKSDAVDNFMVYGRTPIDKLDMSEAEKDVINTGLSRMSNGVRQLVYTSINDAIGKNETLGFDDVVELAAANINEFDSVNQHVTQSNFTPVLDSFRKNLNTKLDFVNKKEGNNLTIPENVLNLDLSSATGQTTRNKPINSNADTPTNKNRNKAIDDTENNEQSNTQAKINAAGITTLQFSLFNNKSSSSALTPQPITISESGAQIANHQDTSPVVSDNADSQKDSLKKSKPIFKDVRSESNTALDFGNNYLNDLHESIINEHKALHQKFTEDHADEELLHNRTEQFLESLDKFNSKGKQIAEDLSANPASLPNAEVQSQLETIKEGFESTLSMQEDIKEDAHKKGWFDDEHKFNQKRSVDNDNDAISDKFKNIGDKLNATIGSIISFVNQVKALVTINRPTPTTPPTP